MALNQGDAAPDFTLPDTDGKKVALKDFKGKYVALYFYPKDDTPGCTKEACNLRDHTDELKKNNIEVIGVSPDDSFSHKKFTEKYTLPFTLLCDTDAKISKKYGVYGEKSMYGKKYMGVARSTFIINKEGKIAKVFEKVTPQGHEDEILDALKEIRTSGNPGLGNPDIRRPGSSSHG